MANELFPLSEFAVIARVTKDTLMHYDKIGVLTPIRKEGNNYRCYTVGHLAIINAIIMMQNAGVSLEKIKFLLTQRNPELALEMFAEKLKEIRTQKAGLLELEMLLTTYISTINSAMNINENEITIARLPSEQIFLGELNDYSEGKDDYTALCAFYRTMVVQYPNIELKYPVWGLFSKEWVESGNLKWPERYYLFNPKGPDERPAALYAVGYTRGGYSQSEGLFRRMLEYIEQQGCEMCGDCYAEYPHNEISIADDTNYLIRLLITVREKKPLSLQASA